MASRLVVIIGADPPARLDKALARDVPEAAHLSRSRLAKLIEEGSVSRGGEVLTSAKMRVAEGDEIALDIPDEAETEMVAEDIPLVVVHEDEDLIVVDKPAGMVVHPAPGSPSGTLVNALLHHFGGNLSGVGGEKRPGIVHRIDKDTSGLLVVAKTDRAHHALADQFAAHTVERRYLALCHGVPSPADPRLMGSRGVSVEPGNVIRIATNLARHPSDRQRQAVTFQGGRHAVTRVQVERDWGEVALIACRLETGRTHQIRVHLRHAGHALIGDPVYGGQRKVSERRLGDVALQLNGFSRQALHAHTLGFTHPSGENMNFVSDLPLDMETLLEGLDAASSDTSA
ncbi:ribosomal large subunit pseudouridine synthase D [Palleronia marisminoris]|uniref:Pseudouridine synthase n=1 Tax=Palleronia marisminoris TaxID=315423 RepID=A0A1Y5RE99_9RHOB|nr:RluA family pseudouridine synthase [Palleronia marisminoris]SFG14795.1 ribosomal large subunit pseudouridine synthase D [Palleronia marisminoris]SLN15443.1 Ribosomal large subunit pseudouridine synthase D [Palleronia marisminoris]